MNFEWDEEKNTINIAKHGIDFNDAILAFNSPVLTKKDNRIDYNEVRFIGIGKIFGKTIVVVWTTRNNRIRIISARLANKNERKIYNEKVIQN